MKYKAHADDASSVRSEAVSAAAQSTLTLDEEVRAENERRKRAAALKAKKARKRTIQAVFTVAACAALLTIVILVGVSLLAGKNIEQLEPLPATGEQSPQDAPQGPPVITDVPFFGYDRSKFVFEARRMRYDDAAVKTYAGIDISEHQENIDWQAVKADGIDFVMLRVGYRGHTEGKVHLDDSFYVNADAAFAAGLHVGAYFYSQALTREEALEEARSVIQWISEHPVDYPVVFDWEPCYGEEYRTNDVSGEVVTECAVAFCDAVAAAGYTPMVYFNLDLAHNRYDLSRIGHYEFWLAEYDGSPTFEYDVDMLQYTCYGEVNGIDDEVDLNISFKDYAATQKQGNI